MIDPVYLDLEDMDKNDILSLLRVLVKRESIVNISERDLLEAHGMQLDIFYDSTNFILTVEDTIIEGI
jgi:hypothetical protein